MDKLTHANMQSQCRQSTILMYDVVCVSNGSQGGF